MSTNFMMKKSIPLGFKSKKKSIPININSNPSAGKFLTTNQINQVAASYLSMGQKIQILKNPKMIHVNTNSALNYYTNPGNDSRQTNSSIGNSYLNNYPNINIKNSELSGINFNNYLNNVSQQNYSVSSNINKNINKYNNLNFKARKNLSTITNSVLSNDIFINGYQTSKNNPNQIMMSNKYIRNNINHQSKNKIISTNSKTNLSKIKQTYSTRPNFLDSRNKTKKIPMKSKIRQYKYFYKNSKPVSTSFSNVYMNKNNNNNIQNSEQRDIFNYVRVDLMNNLNKEGLNNNNNDNIYSKINTIANNIVNNNLYEIKGRHFRHNTASFDNRDIINIFNKNNLLDKSSKNINHLNINNNLGFKGNNNNICINNINSTKNSNLIQRKNNLNNDIISHNNNITYKISTMNKFKKKNTNQFSKGKNSENKIYIKDKKNNVKDMSSKYNTNTNNSNNNNGINPNSNFIYHNYHTNNTNTYNHVIHHIKNNHSINMNINGIKKISIKQREPKKSNIIKSKNSKLISKPIPTPSQKVKANIIPSQRNIKINLTKFLEEGKIKQNNKVIIGRKSLSIKRINKENNSDFSISQLNEKISHKILKNNEEGNDLHNYIANLANNKKIINKTIQEENKHNENNNNNLNQLENNMIIDTNYISNIPEKESNTNKNKNISSKINPEMNQNKVNNHKKISYNINSTNNNNYYRNNKNDYSVDNPPEITNSSNANQLYVKDKENINDMNINNITDITNPNLNEKNYTHENIFHKKIDLSSEKPKNKTNKNEPNEDIYTLKTKDSSKKKSSKKTTDNKIHNSLFDDENLADLPEDYDENFNDLYSIINKMNFSNVLVCVEGLFTPEGRTYNKYKDKFDKFYENLYNKKGNSFVNSNMKPKKRMEGFSATSNTKTNSSSSKKNVINNKYNDLNIVKDLNAY